MSFEPSSPSSGLVNPSYGGCACSGLTKAVAREEEPDDDVLSVSSSESEGVVKADEDGDHEVDITRKAGGENAEGENTTRAGVCRICAEGEDERYGMGGIHRRFYVENTRAMEWVQ